MLDGMDTVLGRVENIFGIRETLQMRANSFPDAKIFFTEKRNEGQSSIYRSHSIQHNMSLIVETLKKLNTFQTHIR